MPPGITAEVGTVGEGGSTGGEWSEAAGATRASPAGSGVSEEREQGRGDAAGRSLAAPGA